MTANFKKPRDTWTEAKGKSTVKNRSGGRCEVRTPFCITKATEVHHRLNRSQGGTWHPALLAHVCLDCHLYLGANPAEAYENGWLIHEWDKDARDALLAEWEKAS